MFCYVNLFKNGNLGITYTLLQLLQILLVVFMGVLFFGESMKINKVFGIIFGIVSIYLLSI